MDSLILLHFSSFIIFSDDPWSLLVSFRQLFKLPLVVECCDVICEWPLNIEVQKLKKNLFESSVFQERSFARTLAETAYPSLAAYLPHLAIPPNPFLHKPDPTHPFFLNPASSFHFSSLFSGDLGKPGRRRKARTVFSDAQLAGLERR